MIRMTNARHLARLLFMSAMISCAPSLHSQAAPGFKYFYDDAGQLFRVLDSSGNLIEYDYDAVGNILQIQRSTVSASALAIFNITPLHGPAGTVLTIYGQGFSSLTSGDIVMINGKAATVLSATDTELTVLVPSGVISGPITVTVNGVTVSSGPSVVFTPTPAPVITSIVPDGAIAGTSIAATVVGSDLLGATFAFSAGATASALNIGTSAATVQITALNNRGIFPLVATTVAGSSTSTVTASNHFIVMVSPDQANSSAISVLNTADPGTPSTDTTNVNNQAMSPLVSILNTADPTVQQGDATNVTDQANSSLVSVLNKADPTAQAGDATNVKDQTISPFVSVLNKAPNANPNGDTTNVTDEADSYIVSVNNTSQTAVARPDALFKDGQGSRPIAVGSLNIASSAGTYSLVSGQLMTLNIDAPAEARSVELTSNGITLERSVKSPYSFSFNAPVGIDQLNLTASAAGVDETEIASSTILQPVSPDVGTRISGRVVDQAGAPVAGAKISVRAQGFFAEYFAADSPLGRLPDLKSLRATHSGLEAGLNWINPSAVFGPDPIGAGMPAYVARYRTMLIVQEEGIYSFALNTTGTAQLQLDHQVITGPVRLTEGRHAIEVTYRKASEPAALQLLWTPPVGIQSAIPDSALVASDPALVSMSSPTGEFAFLGVPARVNLISVRVVLPDGRIFDSVWRSPMPGATTDLSDIVVTTHPSSKELK